MGACSSDSRGKEKVQFDKLSVTWILFVAHQTAS